MAQASLSDAMSNFSEGDSEKSATNVTKTPRVTTPFSHSASGTGGSGGSKLTLREMDKRMVQLESTLASNMSQIMETLNGLKQQQTLGSAQQRAIADDRDSTPSGRHRPLISLNNGIDEDIVSHHSKQNELDTLSLHPKQKELDTLFGIDSRDTFSHVSDRRDTVSQASDSSNNSNSGRYKQYASRENPIMLGELFGHMDTNQDTCSDEGLILDEAQIKILDKSWRTQAPERVTAFKDDYKAAFPVHEKTASVLQVPGLDDIIEPMLAKRHGRDFKPWGRNKQLCSQPLRTIEQLGFQGQMASRMNIIAVSYLQQGLGALLTTLKEKEVNIDRATQEVRDLFDMSTKALDQAGRAGAFHHMIRRKAAVSDTGMHTLTDLHKKALFLPLAGDGVFGKSLQDKMVYRKEIRDQLSDLFPEFFHYKTQNQSQNQGQKRKFSESDNRRPSKHAKTDTNFKSKNRYNSDLNRKSTPSNNYRGNDGRTQTNKTWPKPKENTAGSFRIPKKQ